MKTAQLAISLPKESKSIIDYFGLVLFFDPSVNTPLTVYAAVLDRRSGCKIVFQSGLFKGLQFFNTESELGLTTEEKDQFQQLIENNLDDIVRGWIDFFVFNREPNIDIVTKSLQR